MKILVIGGSYFLGRVFTMIASKENELTLINRGNFSMKRYGVREYKADRKNAEDLKSIPADYYDAVVDFCAYNPGDIQLILENVKGTSQLAKKYIFVSTVDVYERNVGYMKDESAPISKVRYRGEIGEYIYGKICLEKELKEICNKIGTDYTIIRPSIIYGPNNYAPRESEFIRMVSSKMEIEYPKDAEGRFQMVYVKDVAEAIIAACETTKFKEYNICPHEVIGYEDFMKVLTKVADVPTKLKPVTTEEALMGDLFLPFPFTKEETEIYSGKRAEDELGIVYTNLEEGMKKTYNCFK